MGLFMASRHLQALAYAQIAVKVLTAAVREPTLTRWQVPRELKPYAKVLHDSPLGGQVILIDARLSDEIGRSQGAEADVQSSMFPSGGIPGEGAGLRTAVDPRRVAAAPGAGTPRAEPGRNLSMSYFWEHRAPV